MLDIVCVKWGDRYGPDYVNRLYAMVARHLDAGTEGRFTCFTDDDKGLRDEIHVRPLARNVKGWWNKLFLFAPGQFSWRDRVLFFDLDTLIIGDIDEICRYDGEFAILRDFYRPDGWQSSVMAWRGDFGAHIWRSWNREGRPEIEGGDQAWIEPVQTKADRLQDLFPGAFVSYKVDCHPYPPRDAKVVCFHGEPKPHDCGAAWVRSVWHEGNLGGTQLAMVQNTHLDTIRAQMAASARRGLPELRSQPAHERHAVLVGGGPSLAEMEAHIRARYEHGQEIWALNGTHDWLTERLIRPSAMVLLDARAENVSFIDRGIHSDCTYYVASQCHPEVFDRLSRNNARVIRFDIEKLGDCGTTVGTYAMCVAFTEGYRALHLYGFDSCYRDGEGHAYGQALNARENVIDVTAGDRTFKAAPWMAQQAKDFISLAPDFIRMGCEITVHGDGLLPYVAHLMANPAPTAAQIRARELLSRLQHVPAPTGAEIGVFAGDMSRHLLERGDLTLFMVDSWEGDAAAYQGDSGDWHAQLSNEEQEAFFEKAKAAVLFAGDRAKILRARSDAAAAQIADGSLDFVFIDADHSYEGCRADLAAWWPKVKPGGLFAGHDYENQDFPKFGVKRAVDAFAAALGKTVELGDNFTWFIER